MNFQKITTRVVALIFSFSQINAQTILTPPEAIAIALENNLGIKIAENERQIAKNNATKANAGGSPEINFVAGLGGSNVNTRQEFANGQEQNRNFASAFNGNAGVQLTWTLYDGKRMFRTLDRLNAIVQLSDFQLQLAAENLTTDVLLTFSEAVRQNQIIAATKKNLQFYDERIRLAQARVDAGTVGKPILLQTQIDKNVQESLLFQAENALAALKIQLNFLMLKPANDIFNLPDSLVLNENLTLDEFLQAAETGNRQVRIAQQQARIAEITIAETEALYKPRINLNAGYNFARSQNQAGFQLSNQNYGLNAGVTLVYNIFNGHNTRRQVQNAKLLATNAKIVTQQSLISIKSDIAVAFSQWQTARQMIVLENKNLELTRENLKISEDRFRLGGSDILPLREAQKSFEDAQIRLINARQQAKMGEIRLFQLSGRL